MNRWRSTGDWSTFHQLSILDVYSEWRNSIPLFFTFPFFFFFHFSFFKRYPDNCQIATRACGEESSWRDSLIADDNQSARVLEPNSSPISKPGFPKRTDISPLPLIGGFPRNALDDPTFNPSRFAYKCNQLCPR